MDKVIVTNRGALINKYTANGLARIEDAISRLIAGDARQGIKTGRIYIDHKSDMDGFGDIVAAPGDEAGAKKAIDAIASKFEPDYLVLLGGPDVVPHITLDNPLQDLDTDVPSDLPYASPAPHSRNIADFLDMGRVVSRIPAPTGGNNVDFLTTLLDRSVVHRSRSVDDYKSYFAIAAEPWMASTQMSLNQAFGNFAALKLAPPEAHAAIDHDLTNLAHFINCHGLALQPKFFGEKERKFPVAMEGPRIAGKIAADTIITAECCYGAQLYDHVLAGREQPFCLSYLENGAIGFVGSTNISYGPATMNGAADLFAQFFWINLFKGLSMGRAFLQARQEFVRRERMSDPANLKTIGQFVLLGDASLHPCSAPQTVATSALSAAVDAATERKAVRVALASNGKSVLASASAIGNRVTARSRVAGHAALLARVRELASQHGLENPNVAAYRVVGGTAFMSSAKAMGAAAMVTVAIEANRIEEMPDIKVVVAHSLQQDQEHAIAFLRTYVSR